MRTLRNVFAGIGLGLYVAAPAYAVGPFSNQPLYLSSVVSPNLMLVVDNSGSMNNIIQRPGLVQVIFLLSITLMVMTGGGTLVMRWLLWMMVMSAFLACGRIVAVAVMSACGAPVAVIAYLTRRAVTELPDPVGGNATRYTGNVSFIYNMERLLRRTMTCVRSL